MCEWRTFDSAPQDYEPVIAWREDAGWFGAIWESPAECDIAHTWPEDDPRREDFECRWWDLEGNDLAGELMPTHWMRPTDPT